MPRTPWKYVGGPALGYPDSVDTTRLWSEDPHLQLDELERFCRSVQASGEPAAEARVAARHAVLRIERVRAAVREGDLLGAVSAALAAALLADGLALAHEFGPDLRAGQRQREGGYEGGRHRSIDPKLLAEWVRLDQELKGKIKSRRARAEEIGRRTGANPETIRKYLSRRR